MTEGKREQRRVVSVSLPPALLERLDSHRWPEHLTRSKAIQNALENYLPQEVSQEGAVSQG